MARPKKFAIHRGKSLETRTDTQFKNKIDEFDAIYKNSSDGTGGDDSPEAAMIKQLFVKCDAIIDDVDTISLTPGAKGDKGDKGDTGSAGSNGSAGSKGDKGDKGDTGATGATGAAGAKGDKGDTGAAGSNASVSGYDGTVTVVVNAKGQTQNLTFKSGLLKQVK